MVFLFLVWSESIAIVHCTGVGTYVCKLSKDEKIKIENTGIKPIYSMINSTVGAVFNGLVA